METKMQYREIIAELKNKGVPIYPHWTDKTLPFKLCKECLNKKAECKFQKWSKEKENGEVVFKMFCEYKKKQIVEVAYGAH
jgi:hypothetical protein